MSRSISAALLSAAALLLAVPAVAQAHVELYPDSAPAGAEMRLDVRVPNERDDSNTVKVELQLPPGFAEAAFQPVPGWDAKVTKVKLATPVKTDDGEITEGVGRITWTAKSQADGIPPGGFQDFGLSVLIPGKAGDTLTFKALQTYSNGSVVRWIGSADSEAPAPKVKVTAADAGAAAAPAATAAPTSAPAAKDGSSDGLAIVALIVGLLALAAGVAGLLRARASARSGAAV